MTPRTSVLWFFGSVITAGHASAQECSGLLQLGPPQAILSASTGISEQSASGGLGVSRGHLAAVMSVGLERPRHAPTLDYQIGARVWRPIEAASMQLCPNAAVALHLLDNGRQWDGRLGFDAALARSGFLGRGRLVPLASLGMGGRRISFVRSSVSVKTELFAYGGVGVGYRLNRSANLALRFVASKGGVLAPGNALTLQGAFRLGRGPQAARTAR